MNFRIADTFTDSLARLTGEEQKAVKTTAFDLQVNPANPGLSFHKRDDARDKKSAQRQWVERDFAGPAARVCGSAGTGKTIVALHRAVFLARQHPDSRILLTTFSETLANALRTKLRTGWEELVDAWQLERWESYRDVKRLGRKTRLPEAQRAALWAIFESMRAGLRDAGLITRAALFSQLASDLANRRQRPFDFVVVDEAQDVSVPQLRFLAALGADRPSGLFFAGDLGQRIFQPPFSWRSLGVDIRGRARTLHVNYRTSHQIRTQADRLLGPEVSDVDGNAEDRRGTVSALNGPTPRVMAFDSPEGEIATVGAWIVKCVQAGVAPHEIGVFVRSAAELDRAREAVAGRVSRSRPPASRRSAYLRVSKVMAVMVRFQCWLLSTAC